MNVFLKAFVFSFVFFLVLLCVISIVQNKSHILQSVPLPTATRITPVPLPFIGNGDADADNRTGFKDVTFISENWNYSAGGTVDQYRDGKVNSLDFAVTALQLSK